MKGRSSISKQTETKTPSKEELFYGSYYPLFSQAGETARKKIADCQASCQIELQRNPIEHVKYRIKAAASMQDKLIKKGFPPTVDAALKEVRDVVGLRIVCTFVDDVFYVADWLKQQTDLQVIKEKDYITLPKPNGYRSYHLIMQLLIENTPIYVEFQIRTIAMDCWAALEHQLKYKHEIMNTELIVKELKRCADEMASTDLNLQVIRDTVMTQDEPSVSE